MTPGIPCPSCGKCSSKVLETRRLLGGLYRRRMCTCGTRFDTTEVLVDADLSAVVRSTADKMRGRYDEHRETLKNL